MSLADGVLPVPRARRVRAPVQAPAVQGAGGDHLARDPHGIYGSAETVSGAPRVRLDGALWAGRDEPPWSTGPDLQLLLRRFLLSAFLVQKLSVTLQATYSWRLNALHNQVASLALSVAAGRLAYRLARRISLDSRRAAVVSPSVIAQEGLVCAPCARHQIFGVASCEPASSGADGVVVRPAFTTM